VTRSELEDMGISAAVILLGVLIVFAILRATIRFVAWECS